jgi:CBS domain-containing protein
VSPQSIMERLLREVPVLSQDEHVEAAIRRILDAGVPALPVVDRDGRFAGVFGEREFMAAVFPGYVSELKSAAFVSASLDDAIGRRAACLREPVGRHAHTEHVDVSADASDVQIAEIFLHHRVLIVPVCDRDGRIFGVVTRSEFFRALATRLLEAG